MSKKKTQPEHDINAPLSAPASELAKVASEYQGLYSGPDSAYKLAFMDEDFLTSPEMRGVRMQLEISKPEIAFRKHGIKHTITVFGSARFKSPEEAQEMLAAAKTDEEIKAANHAVRTSIHYQKAYEFGKIVGTRNLSLPREEQIIISTGGGPSIMSGANRGSMEVGSLTAGFNITLPFEQEPNPYITPSLCFQFFYFSTRKLALIASGGSVQTKSLIAGEGFRDGDTTGGGSIGICVFAGGIGSLDELFEIFCLVQCGKIRRIPIILVGKEYWSNVFNLQYLADEGAISQKDLELVTTVDTADEAWKVIKDFYSLQK